MIPGQLPTLRELTTAAELAASEQDATPEDAHGLAGPGAIPADVDAQAPELVPVPVPGTPYAVLRTDERGGPGVRILITRGGALVARAWWSEIDREITASDAGPDAIPGAAYLAIERALASA
jgi:hypothetical protein